MDIWEKLHITKAKAISDLGKLKYKPLISQNNE